MAKEYKFTIKSGKPPVEFMPLAEVAKACGGRTKYAFLELISRGIMPDANYRTPARTCKAGSKVGEKIEGTRLYSKDFLVPKLIEIFKGIEQGKTITQEQRAALVVAFQEEAEYYTHKY